MEYHNTISDDTVETRRFILLFDRFFDCLNVRSTKESVVERKPDLRPYRDPADSRLKVNLEAPLFILIDAHPDILAFMGSEGRGEAREGEGGKWTGEEGGILFDTLFKPVIVVD
jgi:hypothetical protein